MAASVVVPFRHPKQRTPTLRELTERVKELAQDSENVGFSNPHLRLRMGQRGITMRQILETIRKGDGVSGPKLDPYGDWRIKMRRLVAGRRVQVVVALRGNRISVVTCI